MSDWPVDLRLDALDEWRRVATEDIGALKKDLGKLVSDREIEDRVNARLRQERQLHLSTMQKTVAAGYGLLVAAGTAYDLLVHVTHQALGLVV